MTSERLIVSEAAGEKEPPILVRGSNSPNEVGCMGKQRQRHFEIFLFWGKSQRYVGNSSEFLSSFWAAEHCLGWWWAVGGGGAGRKKKIPNWQIIDISGSVQLCLFPAHWAFSSSLKLAGNLPHHL